MMRMSKNTTVRLRNPLIARQAIRAQIDESRRSIGLGPLVCQCDIADELNRANQRDDLAKAVARLVAARSRSAQSEERPDTPVVKLSAPPIKDADVRAAIAYGKHLGRRNAGSVVFLESPGTHGKKLYESTLAQMRDEARAKGVVILGDERAAVLRRLDSMPGSGVVKLSSGGGVRLHAPIQKFLDGKTRMVRGYASTNDVDRLGDIVEPTGMIAKLPVPLLFQHDPKLVIGAVTQASIKGNGIWIEASLVTGIPQADEVWQLIEAGAIDSFSIGFRGIRTEPLPTGGLRFVTWELFETSIVAIPANNNAKIRKSVSPTRGAGGW
jgi:HK97 family phage prohead protease